MLGGRQLANVFQLVGGTSTRAVIAESLVLGYSGSDIRDFYLRLAPRVFRRSRWRLFGVQSRFASAPLMREIEAIVGERALGSDDLLTQLAIVMK